ncbi:hypothetical protein EVAR_61626_1 [Eumeta japonica]|uniref:Uncharacterized protein n=1 Tax=Eumeta variegata TaxID=151549 RepID=A0A4C1ZKP8_EUMVA|nr:hypothetical protein EVAR_61626_1 [Eumeta japonica]
MGKEFENARLVPRRARLEPLSLLTAVSASVTTTGDGFQPASGWRGIRVSGSQIKIMQERPQLWDDKNLTRFFDSIRKG